jgi:hypothetical protein
VSVFRVIPTPGDKGSRARRVLLGRALAGPTESLLRDLARQYFQPGIASALSNPVTSLLQARHLIISSPSIRHLSDFIAICVIVVNANPQTSRQAVAFLADPVVQQFEFDEVELDYLMRSLFQRPPKVPSDVKTCGEIIARFCAASESCRHIFLEAVRPGHFGDESRDVLEAAARAIQAEGGAHFSDAALEEIGGFLNSQRRARRPAVATPTAEKMRQLETERRIGGFFARYRVYSVPVFVALTVAMLAALLLLAAARPK